MIKNVVIICIMIINIVSISGYFICRNYYLLIFNVVNNVGLGIFLDRIF